jgi:hypothetical protein
VDHRYRATRVRRFAAGSFIDICAACTNGPNGLTLRHPTAWYGVTGIATAIPVG